VAFNFWAGIFLLYTALILIFDMAISSNVDPQKVVIIAM